VVRWIGNLNLEQEMPNIQVSLENISHFRFTSLLSDKTLDQLKNQVMRVMRDQLDEPLVSPFLNWKKKNNEVFLYATYSTVEFSLPITFDTFFWHGSDNFIPTSVHIPFSIINGWAPTQNVNIGHKYVCLLQFQGEIPEVIKELPEVNDTLNTPFDLILANRLDLPAKDGG
jgi:hypothetical protein